MFMAGFGGNAVVRDRASLVVEFVPVTHSLDVLAENRRIESDSGLEEGELVYTRWIKSMQRCVTGQKSTPDFPIQDKQHGKQCNQGGGSNSGKESVG